MTVQTSTIAASVPSIDIEAENRFLRDQLLRAQETIQLLQSAVDASKPVEESLRVSEGRLETELADTKLLQTISAHLTNDEHVDSLYQKITEAALSIMQSDFATMQMYVPEEGKPGHLRLLAAVGLSEEGVKFWDRVEIEAGTTCAVAMRTTKRYLSSDMQNCEFVVGTPDHEMFVRAGVKSAQSTPLVSRSGKLLGMISTHWTTNHVPSERDLGLLDILARQGADLIERKTAQSAVNLSQAALSDADRRKDEFLATLAHELRNPLSPISNALNIIRLSPHDERVPELASMMDRQLAHLVRLVDDLLDVSRISQGKIELRKDRISLQDAINDAVEASRPLIEGNGQRLTVEVPTESIWLDADATRISQVVGNLLNNAGKYTQSGGHITLSALAEDGKAVLRVSDNGVGIPPEMLSKVFELFTQVDRTLDRSRGGLGIGLALVRQLLGMHGGTIEAASEGVGQGSTFTVRLPLHAVSHASENANANIFENAVPSAGLKVLVVDDNEASAQTTGWMLELGGHMPEMAHNGAGALIAAERFGPEVILLDIGLPDMTGYALCRKFRENPRFKDALIIAQTGWGQDRDKQMAKDAGFDHHLLKPIDLNQLSTLLNTAKH